MSGAQNERLVNPLDLPVEYCRGVTPLHEAHDADRLAALIASMKQNGWQGAPIVADWELAQAGQDRAYTGSHRLAAWLEAHDGDDYEPVPCVWIEDICEAAGIDWAALMGKHEGDAL